jgi:hypothetical protein
MRQDSYHFRLGSFDCLIVLDSTHAYPKPKGALFQNANQEQLREVLSSSKEMAGNGSRSNIKNELQLLLI